MVRLLVVALLALVTAGYYVWQQRSHPTVRATAFVHIVAVDTSDPERWLIDGAVEIKDSKMATELPGAVFVVDLDGVRVHGQDCARGQVLVRNKKGILEFAKPGTVILSGSDRLVVQPGSKL
jgi:hypothetical protein